MWNQELKKLNAVVSEMVKRYGTNSVGVYIISYDEIAPILIQASNYDVLGKVRWYGSDSIVQSPKITKILMQLILQLKLILQIHYIR